MIAPEIDLIFDSIGNFDFDLLLESEVSESVEPYHDKRYGYRFTYDGGVTGVALLSQRNFGYEYVCRLKDAEGALHDETVYWCNTLAKLINREDFDVVTHPPSSGKRLHHLATEMAQYVAWALGLPFASLFVNPAPRGRRATLMEKLHEVSHYEMVDRMEGKRILCVDDVIYTRQTAKRCIQAAAGNSLYFLVLYRA